MSSSTPSPASTVQRPSSEALRHGSRICLALAALMLLAAVPLTAAGWAASIPGLLVLFFRALAILVAGWSFVILRRLAILEREGLRLTGTITGYAQHLGHNGRHHFYPVVRIEDPPFAGRQFQGDDFRFPKTEHPVGSSHPVLAHPTREIFVLDRPERVRQAPWAIGLGAPFLFLLPEIASLILWVEGSS